MQVTHRDKMFNRRHSLNLPEQLPGHYSRKATERTQKATSKVCAQSYKFVSNCREKMKYENAQGVGYYSFRVNGLKSKREHVHHTETELRKYVLLHQSNSHGAFFSSDLAFLQSVADLVGEIAALEQEVIRKELHLLSLYRRAFDQYVSESCSFTSEVPNSPY
jgi:hypothetical protein